MAANSGSPLMQGRGLKLLVGGENNAYELSPLMQGRGLNTYCENQYF